MLIIDEAQNLPLEVLEEVRLLTNLETSSEKLLQIVLCGQPELERKLGLPQVRQLRQRITLRSKTYPLSAEETHHYVEERLRIAGWDGRPVFTAEALETIHRYAHGIPRVINMLCEHALISGFADQKSPIGPTTIVELAREFELDIIGPTAPAQGDTHRERWGQKPDFTESRRLVTRLRRPD